MVVDQMPQRQVRLVAWLQITASCKENSALLPVEKEFQLLIRIIHVIKPTNEHKTIMTLMSVTVSTCSFSSILPPRAHARTTSALLVFNIINLENHRFAIFSYCLITRSDNSAAHSILDKAYFNNVSYKERQFPLLSYKSYGRRRVPLHLCGPLLL